MYYLYQVVKLSDPGLGFSEILALFITFGDFKYGVPCLNQDSKSNTVTSSTTARVLVNARCVASLEM